MRAYSHRPAWEEGMLSPSGSHGGCRHTLLASKYSVAVRRPPLGKFLPQTPRLTTDHGRFVFSLPQSGRFVLRSAHRLATDDIR
jgi:hypothetical protein